MECKTCKWVLRHQMCGGEFQFLQAMDLKLCRSVKPCKLMCVTSYKRMRDDLTSWVYEDKLTDI